MVHINMYYTTCPDRAQYHSVGLLNTSNGKFDMQHRGRPTSSQRFSPLFQPIGPAERAGVPVRRRQPERGPGPEDAGARNAEEGLYIISVAARILRMHPQTLRKYERVGLVQPSRTIGMLRLYSERDIAKLRMIKHLVDELRLNLAGVEMALAVFDRLTSAMDAAERQAARPPATFEQAMQDIFDLFFGRAHPSNER